MTPSKLDDQPPTWRGPQFVGWRSCSQRVWRRSGCMVVEGLPEEAAQVVQMALESLTR